MADEAGAYIEGMNVGRGIVQTGIESYERAKGYRDRLAALSVENADKQRQFEREQKKDQLEAAHLTFMEKAQQAKALLDQHKDERDEAEVTGIYNGKETESARDHRAMERSSQTRADNSAKSAAAIQQRLLPYRQLADQAHKGLDTAGKDLFGPAKEEAIKKAQEKYDSAVGNLKHAAVMIDPMYGGLGEETDEARSTGDPKNFTHYLPKK